MNQEQIRNFSIIAHIDHGKSTLADRLLELTGTVEKRRMQEQILDSNPIERERGITIKLAPVRMVYQPTAYSHQPSEAESGKLKVDSYILNLIDTPGHVDFTYEVSRSLAACEGALLIVDATQGVQAQTIANLNLARKQNLRIIPIINKIDLPNARIEETLQEIQDLGFKIQEVIQISAKTGENVEVVLEAIIERIPPPTGNADAPLRALVFSSQYDTHKGVVVFVRLVDGNIYYDIKDHSQIKQNLRLKFLATNTEITPIEIGYFSPQMKPTRELITGEVGYIATGLKDIRIAKVGDTITRSEIFHRKDSGQASHKSSFDKAQGKQTPNRFHVSENHNLQPTTYNLQPLPGYKEPKPMVFVGLFPASANEFTGAREAMDKLRLSDSAFTFRLISSLALGNGFHCGFLGLLHAEIVQERLLREFGLTMIATSPSVEYMIHLRTADSGNQYIKVIQSAAEFPDPGLIEEVKEPVMEVKIYTPDRYLGAIMQLCHEKRGLYIDTKYFYGLATIEQYNNTTIEYASVKHVDGRGAKNGVMVELEYLIPLPEMIIDFFDRIKSVSEGYASLDYEFFDYQRVEVVKFDILVNHEKVDALSFLAVTAGAERRGREIVDKLAVVIPRQQFAIPIQVAIGGKIIARADVKPFRKDVTAKLYGGDRTRKDKLLDKQKKGKAKMKIVGRVEIPQSAFFQILKRT